MAALYGLIKRIEALGLVLLAITTATPANQTVMESELGDQAERRRPAR